MSFAGYGVPLQVRVRLQLAAWASRRCRHAGMQRAPHSPCTRTPPHSPALVPPPAQADISAGKMIFNVEGVDPARRARLIQMLDIDIYQRLTTMSDGQRRRVQICMGLLKPYDVSGRPQGRSAKGLSPACACARACCAAHCSA